MKIPLVLFLGLALLLLLVGLKRRPWLIGTWIVSFLVLPTVHARFAGAPIYLYDLLGVVLITCFAASGEASRWPRGIPRWHWWFIGSALVLSVVFGLIRFGFVPDLFWIWGHASLAWIAFAFGIIASTAEERDRYRNAIQWGLILSAAACCAIAVVQFIDLPGAENISRTFYRDLGSSESVEILRRGTVKRATGPHFAPTGFAGVALLAILASGFVATRHHRWRGTLVLVLFSITILCTVSRHVMLAACLGVIVLICLSDSRTRFKLIGSSLLVALALCISAAGLSSTSSWSARLAKWDGGLLEDDNIAARVLWGPERLARYISENPSVLITGAGLDIEKLTRHTQQNDFEGGFVSNGFLLALYYLGIAGFVLYALFWIWSFNLARHSSPETRGLLVASVVVQIVLVAADNYSFLHEPAVCLLFLNAGLMAGNRHALLAQEYLEAAALEPQEDAREQYAT